MACIRKRGKSWQVIVARNGVRKSSTWPTRTEAQAWATAEETRLKSLAREASHNGQLRGIKVLAAMTKEDVVRAAKAYPRITGVYFLIAGDDVVYVGQSYDVMGRISTHNKSKRMFDRYAFVEVAEEDLLKVEKAYITAFQPRWNISHNVPQGIGGQNGFYS